MKIHRTHTILFTGLLLLSFAVGCGDPDRNANAGKPGDPLTPPTVTIVTPPSGSVITCPDIPIVSATFSKAMNPVTFKASTFIVTGASGARVDGAFTYAVTTNTVTFIPVASFAPSTKFTATITTGVADTFGNTLETNYMWTFTTSASCANVPPTVILATPPDGDVVTCPDLPIVSATFSKAMDPATITNSTFKLTGPGETNVAGKVSYDDTSDTATFTPDVSLPVDTQFTGTINTGVADNSGNSLESNFVWTFTTSPSCAATPPTVIRVTPPKSNVAICPNNDIVSATFSKAMNPSTISSSTFTLTGTDGANLVGAVTYVAATHVATFTPAAPSTGLPPNTTFTGTITNGVADTLGNNLAANFVWTFKTSATCPITPRPALASACSFGILAGSTVTNVAGTATHVNGDVAVSPGTAITGFDPPAVITGSKHANDLVAQTAKGDLTTAYNHAAGAAGGAVLTADIGGQTLPPGVYRTTSAQPSLGITGDLTLDGKGDPNAVWIIQIVSTLKTAAGNSHVILIGNAQSKNVFWQVGSSATLGTNTIFAGTILANISITGTTGATLNGRALTRIGAVTLDTNIVNVPPCQ